MTVSLSFPDSNYSESNKPSVETLKSDLNLIETDLNAHETDTSTHGVSGDIVGTSGSQTLLAKTLTSPAINTPTITTPTIKTWDGWQSVTDSWAYASADDPTFTITVPAGAASIYGVGMRIKLTQTTVKYFIITAVADTVLTVYGGTDYDLANAEISAISYSTQKAPLGFPLDPTKWTVSLADTSERTGSLDGTNYLNIGTTNSQLSMPIGVWNVYFSVYFLIDRTTAGTDALLSTALSTANNSASDAGLTAFHRHATPGYNITDVVGTTMQASKLITNASKTLYYLNAKCDAAGTGYFNRSGVGTTQINFVCAYL